jgi:hypothetical protein
MTTTEDSTEQEEMWRTFFDDNHADLAIVAEMLLICHLSPETVLRKTLTGLENSTCEVSFAQAIRSVIETAIEYNRENANSRLEATIPPAAKLRVPGLSQIATLPWPDRAVYFLCGVLHYSYRETALLLDLSDIQIDQFYKFAVRRMGYKSRTTRR